MGRTLTCVRPGGYSRDMQEVDRPEDPEDPDDAGIEWIEPEDFLPADPFPLDARRMGIDRWSDDAGMIAVAASLNPAKPSHRIFAWLMLLAITVPLALNLWYEIT
jgi:hypothetical protein